MPPPQSESRGHKVPESDVTALGERSWRKLSLEERRTGRGSEEVGEGAGADRQRCCIGVKSQLWDEAESNCDLLVKVIYLFFLLLFKKHALAGVAQWIERGLRAKGSPVRFPVGV